MTCQETNFQERSHTSPTKYCLILGFTLTKTKPELVGVIVFWTSPEDKFYSSPDWLTTWPPDTDQASFLPSHDHTSLKSGQDNFYLPIWPDQDELTLSSGQSQRPCHLANALPQCNLTKTLPGCHFYDPQKRHLFAKDGTKKRKKINRKTKTIHCSRDGGTSIFWRKII